MKNWIGALGILLLLCCLSPEISLAQDLVWNVSTDHASYRLGEPVTLSLEVCNTGAVTETVDINVAPAVIDSDNTMVFAPSLNPWVIWEDVPPGECRSASDQVWSQLNSMTPPPYLQVPPGWYRGMFLSIDNNEFFSSPFEIRDVQPVPISRPASLLLLLLMAVSGWAILRTGT